MSLNQKYTWQNFLKEHPDFRGKGIKRTSPDGKKAFESAYKTFIRKYLAMRAERIEKEMGRATKRRDTYVLKLKELRKSGKHPRAKLTQKKVGCQDSAIARLAKQKERNTTLQKEFK